MKLLILLAAQLAAATTAVAQTSPPAAPGSYESHMRAADAEAVSAAMRAHHNQSIGLPEKVERIVAEYELASRADPSKAEPHYRAAEIAYAHKIYDKARPDPRWCARALAHWVEFERLSPRDPRLEMVLFRRSITYTKLGGEENFKKALADYEALLRIGERATEAATILSNTAELYMAVGELEPAITHYKRALELDDRPLYGYGLALALWRYGQAARALEIMRRYGYSDRLRAIKDDKNVFFVPEGEIHAYLALGHEALGERKEAIAQYKLFLASGAAARYGKKVEQHLQTLKRGKK